MSSVETGQMSSVETGQMSAVETGQMSAAETGQMSAVPESSGLAWASGAYRYSAEGNNRNNIITETALPAVCNNRNVSPGAWATGSHGASR